MKNDRIFPILALAILAGVITSFVSVDSSTRTTAQISAEVQPVSFESTGVSTN